MPDRVETFKAYDATIAALIAHDEAHSPARARLLRDMFAAQRVFFHELIESVEENNQEVSGLADRVQNHISRQLLDILDASAKASKVHADILAQLGALEAQQGEILAAVLSVVADLKQGLMEEQEEPHER